MKMDKIRVLTTEELRQKLQETREALFRLRFQASASRLENPAQYGGLKRDVARMFTELRSRGIQKFDV